MRKLKINKKNEIVYRSISRKKIINTLNDQTFERRLF